MKTFAAVLLFAVALLSADDAFGEKNKVWQEAKLLSFGMEHWVSTGSSSDRRYSRYNRKLPFDYD